jgi:hypothetical protein
MIKLNKFSPYLILLAAIILFYWVKTNQRGSRMPEPERVTVETRQEEEEGFTRQPDSIFYTRHSRCRMNCRKISEAEIKEIIAGGKLNKKKIQSYEDRVSYPLEGKTSNDRLLRIVVATRRNSLVIVTAIDLDRDWPCDCK